MMGFPVRVMEMSDKKRFPTTVWTALRVERAADKAEDILAILLLTQEPIVCLTSPFVLLCTNAETESLQ